MRRGSTLYLSATDQLRLDGIDVNSLSFDPERRLHLVTDAEAPVWQA